MAITSQDIHNQSFAIDRKGYDVDEVDVFLEHVADEIDFLNDQIAQLQNELMQAREAAEDTTSAEETTVISADTTGIDVTEIADGDMAALIAEKDAIIKDLEEQLSDKKANDNAISQALIIAQRSADEIIVKANAQASETMQDAREEADRIINRANADKQGVVDDIHKLEDDREETREGYADLLRDFIEDASRKLNELGFRESAAMPARWTSSTKRTFPWTTCRRRLQSRSLPRPSRRWPLASRRTFRASATSRTTSRTLTSRSIKTCTSIEVASATSFYID